MQRLVLVCPDVLGGVRSYVLNLSEFLRNQLINHIIVLYSTNDTLDTVIEGRSTGVISIKFSKYASPKSIYKEFADLILERDILICNDSLELEAVNFMKLTNYVIYILHGDLKHYDSILKTNEQLIDHVFCVSKGLKEKYANLYPNLSFSVSNPLVKNFKTIIDNRIAKSHLRGVFIGRFEYLKGADTFLEVVEFCALKKMPVHWRAFIPTKGSDYNLITGLPSEVEVIFDSSNEKILMELIHTDFLLFPSRSEGFGIAVLEAMKRGVIPITRDLPIGIPDLIIDKENGYIANDSVNIVSIIEQFLQDRVGMDKMKLNVMHFANSIFDYEKLGCLFMENIHQVVQQQRSRNKLFNVWNGRITEKIFPEPFYRFVKCLHNNMKYGRNS